MRSSLPFLFGFACLAGRAEATTAIITRPATTQHIAGFTREQFSAMDSYKTSAGDCTFHLGSAEWTFGDGGTGYGFEVIHVYASAGTYTVTLTVYDDAGGSSSPAYSSVTVVDMAQWGIGIRTTKYIRSDGSDSTTHSGDFNTSQDAWLTFDKYVDFVVNHSGGHVPTDGWNICYIRAGDSITFSGTSGTLIGVDYGPILITKIGVGAKPVLVISSAGGVEFQVASDYHDNTADYPVYLHSIDFTSASGTRQDHSGTKITMAHAGSQMVDCDITKIGLELLGYGNLGTHRAFGMVVDNCSVSGANANGVDMFGPPDHIIVNNCYFHGNGLNASGPNEEHEIYVGGVTYLGILNTTCDGSGATGMYSGLKTSGTQKAYFKAVTVKNSPCGYDVGGNVDEETDDIIYDGCVADGINDTGWFCNNLDRVCLRSCRSYSGCGTSVVRISHQSNGTTGLNHVGSLQVLGSSSYHPGGPFLYADQSDFSQIGVENCVAEKANGTAPILRLLATADAANIAADYNQWFVDGTTNTLSNLFHFGNTDVDFSTWVSSYGEDTHGAYGDPKFNAPSSKDLSLQSTSPCVDSGFADRLLRRDALFNLRTSVYDKGALER